METPNNEIKAMFFAQYFGQTILKEINQNYVTAVLGERLDFIRDSQYIELTSLELISDEDAIEVAKLLWKDKTFQTAKNGVYYIETLILIELSDQREIQIHNALLICDFLRSKGYALPFREYSVEDLVNFGWVKLK